MLIWVLFNEFCYLLTRFAHRGRKIFLNETRACKKIFYIPNSMNELFFKFKCQIHFLTGKGCQDKGGNSKQLESSKGNQIYLNFSSFACQFFFFSSSSLLFCSRLFSLQEIKGENGCKISSPFKKLVVLLMCSCCCYYCRNNNY